MSTEANVPTDSHAAVQTAMLEPVARSSTATLVTALTVVFLCLFPLFSNTFVLIQVGAQTFIYGIIALGLTFLAGQGGMVSLAQISVAGLAGYSVAIFGVNSAGLGLEWHWLAVVVCSLTAAVLFGTLIGLLSLKTDGVYTIMITLAIATCFFYFTRQNYAVFNGFTGFSGIKAPVVLGVNLRDPIVFYYLCLVMAALCLVCINHLIQSTFGMALQGVRDNARRLSALGFSVKWHRVAAYSIAALLAAIGGVLMVWMNDRIDPSSIGVGPAINILIIAVIGGLKRPIGAFIGALIFVLMDIFAVDFIDRERFNTLIGSVFLLIVLFSPDGVLGLWERFVRCFKKKKINS